MKGPVYMITIILHLILPMVFYTAITTVLFLCLNLGALEATALSAVFVSPILYFFYRRDQKDRGIIPAVSLKLNGCLVYILVFGAALCVFGNYIVEALRLTEMSAAYEEVSRSLYSPTFLIQILASGLLIPVAEELIFRGLVFASLRGRLSFLPAAVLSGLIFGLYHGNLPQGVYAFLIGLALSWLYEVCGTLLAPYLFHVSANIVSLCVTNIAYLGFLFDAEDKPVMAVMVAASAAVSVICAIRIYWKNNLKEDIV